MAKKQLKKECCEECISQTMPYKCYSKTCKCHTEQEKVVSVEIVTNALSVSIKEFEELYMQGVKMTVNALEQEKCECGYLNKPTMKHHNVPGIYCHNFPVSDYYCRVCFDAKEKYLTTPPQEDWVEEVIRMYFDREIFGVDWVNWIASKKKYWLEQQRAEILQDIKSIWPIDPGIVSLHYHCDCADRLKEDLIISLNKYRE